jgi:hypothetical protein
MIHDLGATLAIGGMVANMGYQTFVNWKTNKSIVLPGVYTGGMLISVVLFQLDLVLGAWTNAFEWIIGFQVVSFLHLHVKKFAGAAELKHRIKIWFYFGMFLYFISLLISLVLSLLFKYEN